jgi:hypothetical protein
MKQNAPFARRQTKEAPLPGTFILYMANVHTEKRKCQTKKYASTSRRKKVITRLISVAGSPL